MVNLKSNCSEMTLSENLQRKNLLWAVLEHFVLSEAAI